ncbi:hypothetical protein BDW69DRAFT_166877 [Aspergillus filifer]
MQRAAPVRRLEAPSASRCRRSRIEGEGSEYVGYFLIGSKDLLLARLLQPLTGNNECWKRCHAGGEILMGPGQTQRSAIRCQGCNWYILGLEAGDDARLYVEFDAEDMDALV